MSKPPPQPQSPTIQDHARSDIGQKVAEKWFPDLSFPANAPHLRHRLADIVNAEVGELEKALEIANRSADDQMFQKRVAEQEVADLRAKLAASAADTERLDWLETEAKGKVFEWIRYYRFANFSGSNPNVKGSFETIREAIDAARGKEQS